MKRISSAADLLDTFRALDRDEVQIPSDFRFPLALRDYLAWVEPSGHRVYLVFEDVSTGQSRGVVFQRTHGSADASPAMCQWCHSVRGGNLVSLFTAAASRNRRVGTHVCTALNCRENALNPPGLNDFHEGLVGQEKVQRILQRMTEFANRNLF